MCFCLSVCPTIILDHEQRNIPPPYYFTCQIIDTKESHVRSLIPRSGQVRSLIPRCGHVRSLIPRSSHVRSLIQRSGHVRSLIPRSGHVWSLIPRSGHVRSFDTKECPYQIIDTKEWPCQIIDTKEWPCQIIETKEWPCQIIDTKEWPCQIIDIKEWPYYIVLLFLLCPDHRPLCDFCWQMVWNYEDLLDNFILNHLGTFYHCYRKSGKILKTFQWSARTLKKTVFYFPTCKSIESNLFWNEIPSLRSVSI